MTYFAGLDVSLEETSICVVDEAGRIVKELRTASEPEAVATAGARKIRSSSGHRGEQRRLKRYRPTHAVCQIKYQLVHLTKRLLDITRKEEICRRLMERPERRSNQRARLRQLIGPIASNAQGTSVRLSA